MPTTTKRDFEIFKEEIRKWVDKFGLQGWRIYFYHEILRGEIEGAFAACRWDLAGRVAIMKLNRKWDEKPTEARVRRTAFHEICELLLSRLFSLAKIRFLDESEIDEEKHSIIRTLEAVFFRHVD